MEKLWLIIILKEKLGHKKSEIIKLRFLSLRISELRFNKLQFTS